MRILEARLINYGDMPVEIGQSEGNAFDSYGIKDMTFNPDYYILMKDEDGDKGMFIAGTKK